MVTTAPEVRVVVFKIREQPTFLNVYLATGELVGTEELTLRKAVALARDILNAASLDLTDAERGGGEK